MQMTSPTISMFIVGVVMLSPWIYQNKQIDQLPDDCEAFVYIITNKKNDMKYVGKKLAKFKTTKPPLKGKKE